MDTLALARWQFGITTVYHFFFVPLTLGLSILVALMETLYVRSGNEMYKRMTKFWGRLFLINFAMGVVTGIVQEFQFGMNWSEYSRYVGDIFGAPLAVEALLAFFLESVFLGVWIFGWDKLTKKGHCAVMWLVALGSNLSALWILAASSWMHEPVGYVLRNGRAEMQSFLALLTNPHFPIQLAHTLTAAITTAGFFVLGVSAYHLWKKSKDLEVFRKSFRMGAIYGLIGSILVIGAGHAQARHIMKVQPMKMAAAEAHWDTEDPAQFAIFAVPDRTSHQNRFAIRIPYMLSVLAYSRPAGEVKGIKELQAQYEQKYGPGDYAPNIWISFYTFRLMVGAGMLLVLAGLYAVWKTRKGNFDLPVWSLRALLWAVALPYIANSTGWIMAEMGRQPWLVFGLLKTEQGLSLAPGPGAVLFSLVAFTLIYGILMLVDIYLLKKFIRKGSEASDKPMAA